MPQFVGYLSHHFVLGYASIFWRNKLQSVPYGAIYAAHYGAWFRINFTCIPVGSDGKKTARCTVGLAMDILW